MHINEVARRCITGGCNFFEIQNELRSHNEVNLIALIGLVLLFITIILFKKRTKLIKIFRIFYNRTV